MRNHSDRRIHLAGLLACGLVTLVAVAMPIGSRAGWLADVPQMLQAPDCHEQPEPGCLPDGPGRLIAGLIFAFPLVLAWLSVSVLAFRAHPGQYDSRELWDSVQHKRVSRRAIGLASLVIAALLLPGAVGTFVAAPSSSWSLLALPMLVAMPQTGVGYNWMARPDWLPFVEFLVLCIVPWVLRLPRAQRSAATCLSISTVFSLLATILCLSAAIRAPLLLYSALFLYAGVHAAYGCRNGPFGADARAAAERLLP